jgi:hypothetical protein
MDDGMLLEIRRRVESAGPDRVLVDQDGGAMSPARARMDFGIRPEVVFIRNDGWALGASRGFEQVAYSLWADSWAARMDLVEGVWVMTRCGARPALV